MKRSEADKRRKKLEGSRSRESGMVAKAVGRHRGDSQSQKATAALAIQLALDPHVASARYVSSLPLFDRSVQIQMLVADTTNGRIAFDIVDVRRERDLDEDGLLLLTLEHHDIRLVEIDLAIIGSEPRASNCRKIWRHRDFEVKAVLSDAIERALAARPAPTIRALGRMVGLRYPMKTVCASICRKRLQVDLGKRRLDLNSVVRLPDQKTRAGFLVQAEAPRERPPTGPGMEYGGNE